MIAIDALPREQVQPEQLWTLIGIDLNKRMNNQRTRSKIYRDDLTFEKAVDMSVEWTSNEVLFDLNYFRIKSTRSGISNQAARLLTDRSIRFDESSLLFFLRRLSLIFYRS